MQSLERDGSTLVLRTNTDLDQLYATLKAETDVPFIDGTAAIGDSRALNAWLELKGSPLRFGPLKNDEIGAVGTIRIECKWAQKILPDTLVLNSRNVVPAITLPCAHYQAEGNDILEVTSASGFSIYVMTAPRKVTDDFLSLQRFAARLLGRKLRANVYDKIHVPMIDLERSFQHSAVIGKIVERSKGEPLRIGAATIHAKLQMDETGATAETEEIVELTPFGVGAAPQHQCYEIKDDFIIWFENKGTCYFSAYIGEDCMKRPSRAQQH